MERVCGWPLLLSYRIAVFQEIPFVSRPWFKLGAIHPQSNGFPFNWKRLQGSTLI